MAFVIWRTYNLVYYYLAPSAMHPLKMVQSAPWSCLNPNWWTICVPKFLWFTSSPLQFPKFFFSAILLLATNCLPRPPAVTVNNRATTTSPPTADLSSSQVVDLKSKQKSFATTTPQCPQVLRLRHQRINLVVIQLLLLQLLPLHSIYGDLRPN